MKLKTAICIPVYKHQSVNLIQNINNIDKRFDVYIIAQTNDPNLDCYKQYKWDDNIKLEIADVDNIYDKREWTRMEMSKRGYDGYIQIDDDIRYKAQKITPESKRTTSDSYRCVNCDFNELLIKMVETAEEYDAGFVSPFRPENIGFQKPGNRHVNKCLNVSQIYFYNLHKMDESDIHYDTSRIIYDDIDIVFQFIQNGHNCVTLGDYTYAVSDHEMKSKSVTYENFNAMFKLRLGVYLKYHVPLVIARNGRLTHRTPWKKYFNTKELPPITTEYGQKLYDLCKEGDVDKVMEYIKENGNCTKI